ncbi:MAG: biotin apo-protein ligase-related protein [Micavibrio sp.]|nr:biotin apo-protein ligase-related protein [Micavibrio sp.]
MQITGKKPSILIYQDYVHNNGQLYHALVERYGFAVVGYCDAASIIAGILDPTVKLLVMPGGADLYYCEKLNGAGNRAIRNFVENGGSYLGICAGAYYACDRIEWARGSDREISGSRELKLYGGLASGPITEFIQGLDQSWLASATISGADISTSVCYEAGPIFAEPSAAHEKIIARYTSLPGQPPAIVESQIGKGQVILSSPHIERQMPSAWSDLYSVNNPHYDHMHKVYKNLSKDRAQQGALWNLILDKLVGTIRTEAPVEIRRSLDVA